MRAVTLLLLHWRSQLCPVRLPVGARGSDSGFVRRRRHSCMHLSSRDMRVRGVREGRSDEEGKEGRRGVRGSAGMRSICGVWCKHYSMAWNGCQIEELTLLNLVLEAHSMFTEACCGGQGTLLARCAISIQNHLICRFGCCFREFIPTSCYVQPNTR